MGKKIFEVEISNDGPRGYETATELELPATWAEFHDALEKARITDGSCCGIEATEIHHKEISEADLGKVKNLYELNLFAQRLSMLEEDQACGFEGLLQMERDSRTSPIPLQRLIDLTFHTDSCLIAPNVHNISDLGAYLIHNGMLSDAAASLLVLSMSVTAFAEPPQTVIGADGNGTSITITDITPREDEENEQKAERKTNYKVGSFYPIEIQTAEEDRIRLLVKTFLVPQGTDPAALVEEGMTRGVAHFAYKTALRERQYAVSKIREIPQDNWDYLMRTEDNRLTLITCITGKPDSRLMVQAVEA